MAAEPGAPKMAQAIPPSLVEVELKFRADDPAPLRRLQRRQRLGPARLGPAQGVRVRDRYLDTPDARVEAAGWACRLRTIGAETRLWMKRRESLAAGDVAARALHRRPELEGEADLKARPDLWPDSRARQILLELAGKQPLTEILSLDQLRTERDAIVEGTSIGTLSLDQVAVTRAGAVLGRLWAVELEFARAVPPDDHIDALRRALQAIRGLEPDPFSKLEHAEALVRAGAGVRTKASVARD